MSREAQCPDCGEWNRVAWQDLGFWWAESTTGGCPSCGALVCVESECDFRTVADWAPDVVDMTQLSLARECEWCGRKAQAMGTEARCVEHDSERSC